MMDNIYLSACNANGEEVGVQRVVALVDYPGVALENTTDDLEVLSALGHKCASSALCDLDVLFEDVWVLEAQLQGGNGHGLWDGAEVEDTLFAEASKVEKTVVSTLESKQDHLGATCQGLLLVLGVEEVLKLVNVL